MEEAVAAILAKFALTEGMKGFLGKFGMPLLIMIAIGLAVVTIDQRGFNRAKEQDRKAELERQLITAAVVQSIDGQLDKRLGTIAARLGVKIDTIDREGKTVVHPIIMRELARDPHLAAPDSCLSPGLLAAVNAARGYPAGPELGQAGSANPRPVPGPYARH
jgi:hypothetical protein